ncbi:hypothetical protein [Ruminococcus sp. NK3A76]|uniref:hypothetical protein n=1 Tax=Ruminococcus sp. NK3A76 TaxID=877411 RepID=UPI0004906789|nr:hypothetical protein [Ruminococcus sp. NK3A76]
MKKIISAILSLVLVFNCGSAAFAEGEYDTHEDEITTEEYIYTRQISNYLSISNNTASCLSTVMGYPDVTTKIRIEQILQKKNGSSWSNKVYFINTYNTYIAIYSTQKSDLQSGTYRLKTIAKVYSGDDYETITKYSNTCTC